jgi:succinyl-CoA synthetase beta subunit
MDLLEYQGKQLFRKHAVPTPEGRHAARVAEAVEAAEELGCPVVVALDAKVTIDGSALYRHPDVAEMRDVSAEDPQGAARRPRRSRAPAERAHRGDDARRRREGRGAAGQERPEAELGDQDAGLGAPRR